jgi:hypothetical protein
MFGRLYASLPQRFPLDTVPLPRKNTLCCWFSGVPSGEHGSRSRTDTATPCRPGKRSHDRNTGDLPGSVHAAYDHAP